MNKSVWAVEQGSYSDYHVVGVFSKREYAEQVAMAVNGGDRDVAEWVLDPNEEQLHHGLVRFQVHMVMDGSEARAYPNWEVGPLADVKTYHYKHPNYGIMMECWAKDAAHAIKILNEHRAQLIANGGA